MKAEIKEEIRKIVGAEHVIDKYEDLYCYSYDASSVVVGKENLPALVALPGVLPAIPGRLGQQALLAAAAPRVRPVIPVRLALPARPA